MEEWEWEEVEDKEECQVGFHLNSNDDEITESRIY